MTMFAVIITNLIFVLLDMLNMITFSDTTDLICFTFYACEFCVKIIGEGYRKYFDDIWNQFDFSFLIY